MDSVRLWKYNDIYNEPHKQISQHPVLMWQSLRWPSKKGTEWFTGLIGPLRMPLGPDTQGHQWWSIIPYITTVIWSPWHSILTIFTITYCRHWALCKNLTPDYRTTRAKQLAILSYAIKVFIEALLRIQAKAILIYCIMIKR